MPTLRSKKVACLWPATHPWCFVLSSTARCRREAKKQPIKTDPDQRPLSHVSSPAPTFTATWGSKQAAQYEGAIPPLCVAVEDSASGVGSAYAAEMGLIVGYVGASHISEVS